MEYDRPSMESAIVQSLNAKNNNHISHNYWKQKITTNNSDFLSTNAHIRVPNKEIKVGNKPIQLLLICSHLKCFRAVIVAMAAQSIRFPQ